MTNDKTLIPTADDVLVDLTNPLADALTDKQRDLVDRMVATGETALQAAAAQGISRAYTYRALNLPKVRAYLDSELDALRTGGKAKRLHFIDRIVDRADRDGATAAQQKVGLEAVKYLDGGATDERGVSVNLQINIPGYVIDLSGGRDEPGPTIDLHPAPPSNGSEA